jgi:hypothetical protein
MLFFYSQKSSLSLTLSFFCVRICSLVLASCWCIFLMRSHVWGLCLGLGLGLGLGLTLARTWTLTRTRTLTWTWTRTRTCACFCFMSDSDSDSLLRSSLFPVSNILYHLVTMSYLSLHSYTFSTATAQPPPRAHSQGALPVSYYILLVLIHYPVTITMPSQQSVSLLVLHNIPTHSSIALPWLSWHL